MPKGSFAKISAPKITRHQCESCGANDWQIVEEENGQEPAIISVSREGFGIPPPSISMSLLICKNCLYTRFYAIPANA